MHRFHAMCERISRSVTYCEKLARASFPESLLSSAGMEDDTLRDAARILLDNVLVHNRPDDLTMLFRLCLQEAERLASSGSSNRKGAEEVLVQTEHRQAELLASACAVETLAHAECQQAELLAERAGGDVGGARGYENKADQLSASREHRRGDRIPNVVARSSASIISEARLERSRSRSVSHDALIGTGECPPVVAALIGLELQEGDADVETKRRNAASTGVSRLIDQCKEINDLSAQQHEALDDLGQRWLDTALANQPSTHRDKELKMLRAELRKLVGSDRLREALYEISS